MEGSRSSAAEGVVRTKALNDIVAKATVTEVEPKAAKPKEAKKTTAKKSTAKSTAKKTTKKEKDEEAK